MRINELIQEAESLPIEERVLVVDSLLRTLNPTDSVYDKKWAKIAKKRLEEIRSGEVETKPGEQVFERIWKRYEG